MEQEEKLSQGYLFALSSGLFGVSMVWTLNLFIMPLLLEDFLQGQSFIPLKINIVLALAAICGVIIPPIAGRYSDRLRTSWGRRKPFILVGTIITAISLVLAPHTGFFFILVLDALVFYIVVNAYQIPIYALLPECVPHKQRGEASIYFGAMRAAGAGAAVIFGTLLVSFSLSYPFYITAFLVVLSSFLTIIALKKENVEYLTEEEELPLPPLRRAITYVNDLRNHRESMRFFAAQFFWFFGFIPLIPSALLFIKNVLKIDLRDIYKVIPLGVFIGLVVLITMWIAGILGDRYGHKRVVCWGLGILTIAFFVGYFTRFIAYLEFVYFAAFLMAVGGAFLVSEPLALLAEYVPEGREAEFYGLNSLSIALPQAPALLIAGLLASFDILGRYTATFLLASVSMFVAWIVLRKL